MTIGKLYQILLLCTAVVATGLLFSCTTAEEDDSLLLETEEEVIEKPAKPKPDWYDGVMTITVGRFETREEIVAELEKNDFHVGISTEGDIMDENFTITPPEEQYTIDVAVVTMPEVGLTEPATKAEIEERFQENGYLPLTPEEIIEIRLRLKDQPDTSTGHRMSAFFSLPTKELDVLSQDTPYVHIIYSAKTTDAREATRGIIKTVCRSDGSRLFDPNGKDPFGWIGGSRREVITHPADLSTRFVAAIRGTKKSK